MFTMDTFLMSVLCEDSPMTAQLKHICGRNVDEFPIHEFLRALLAIVRDRDAYQQLSNDDQYLIQFTLRSPPPYGYGQKPLQRRNTVNAASFWYFIDRKQK